ncbi:MAG: hypothetical protein IT280_06705 [Ignavibacteria bacterium]|nr:hypothetical protein [Ignavibacteria bacterium]
MISFTCDINWSPEEVILDTIGLFEEHNVRCTFFSTHSSIVLSNLDKKKFEVAIHPNFNQLLNLSGKKRAEDILDDILEIYPEAKGVRSYSLMQSINLLQLFADRHLVYEANSFLPYQTGLKPFKLWNGLVRIPYNWEDDVHWSYGFEFEDCGINLNDDGLNIFDFHPIHIFLNTENKFRYNEAKKFYHDPKKLKEFQNSEVKGARDMLISLLKYVNENKIETIRQIDIAQDCLKKFLF